jgi:multiple sugar transport system ATP-binding protein
MAVMDKGRIKQVGSPAEFFHRPANIFVASFIGSTPMNLLDGLVNDGKVSIGSMTFDIPEHASTARTGDPVVFGVRPEYVSLVSGPGSGIASGVVKVTENLGTHYLVTADCNGILVRGTAPDGSEPAMGETVHLKPEPGRSLLYNKTSEDLY